MKRLSGEQRHVLMARLLEQRRTAGLVAEDVRRTAWQVGIAERTRWRWLAGALRRTYARSSYELTDTDLDDYAAASGNIAAAWSPTMTGDTPPNM